ncbi:MAG: FAD binding domain-containing protein [Anaerolineales bacterium]
MIIEYQRPKTISEALAFLSREEPISYPLGGGTVLNRDLDGQYAVVDLQALGLGTIAQIGNQIHLGATTTLQQLIDFKGLPEDLHTAIKQEATYNLRQMATVAGTLVTADGRSPFTTVMLAMDAGLEMLNLDKTKEQTKLGNWLPLRAIEKPNAIITKIIIPIQIKVAYEMIARTPADQPIVCAVVTQWASGRTRLALGGWGQAPILGMDGPEAGGIEATSRNAYSLAGDEWTSAEYRQEMAGVLALRCLQRLNQ